MHYQTNNMRVRTYKQTKTHSLTYPDTLKHTQKVRSSTQTHKLSNSVIPVYIQVDLL